MTHLTVVPLTAAAAAVLLEVTIHGTSTLGHATLTGFSHLIGALR